jgi:prepilin-type N-terminal cleavage/methylation domain-containing protein
MMSRSRIQAGFTIIELLIATVVFSVVLLMLASAIIQIGRVYTKGLTGAHTQEVARNLVNGVATAIQLTAGAVQPDTPAPGTSNSSAVCIGSLRYSYMLGQQVTDTTHGVMVDETPTGCSQAQPLDDPAATFTGNEVLGTNMRLAYLDVSSPDDKTWTVDARVVYGDGDLLCDGTPTNSCTDGTSIMTPDDIATAGQQVRCKDISSGTQFCFVSEIRTTVERRILQ